jgi:prolyl 4-hydroxylase
LIHEPYLSTSTEKINPGDTPQQHLSRELAKPSNSDMAPSSPQPSPARTRGLLEILLLSGVLYIIFGAPGLSSLSTFTLPSSLYSLSSSSSSSSAAHHDTASQQPREKLQSIVYPTPNLSCPPHAYRIHIFSTTPLVLYIPSFLSREEIQILKDLSAPSYRPSTLFTSSRESHDPTIRLSEKSLLPRAATVRCIEARALALQGWPKHTFIERLWTQRYNVSGHYKLHYDWGAASVKARRVSSFMVYLSGGEEDDDDGGERLEGGGTHFPRLRHPVSAAAASAGKTTPSSSSSSSGDEASAPTEQEEEDEWCKFIACPSNSDSSSIPADGVTFLPLAGNAVFWQNFDAAGRGYKETLHAGLPVTRGQKIGLNIWSWFQAGHEPPEEGEDDGEGDGDGDAKGNVERGEEGVRKEEL